MKKLLVLLTSILLVLFLAMPASAIQFTLSGVTIDSFSETDGALGLEIETDASTYIPFTTNDLTVGQSQTFDLFDIWTTESWINSDDTAKKGISVELSFSSPQSTGGLIEGETFGVSFFYGVFQQGKVEWGNPVDFAFGNGGEFTVELLDTSFGGGVLGLSDYEGTVQAKLTYNSAAAPAPEPAPVPEPATMLLLGTGLVGLASVSRKKFFKKG